MKKAYNLFRKRVCGIFSKISVYLKAGWIQIQIDHQPDATTFQFIILTFIYSSTCFGHSPAHHQELDCSSSLSFYLRIVVIAVLCSWSGQLTGLTMNTAGENARNMLSCK